MTDEVQAAPLKLICVDGSIHSDRAVEWFFKHIYKEGDEVGLAHVHVLPDLPSFGFSGHPDVERLRNINFFKDGEPIQGHIFQQKVHDSIQESKEIADRYKQTAVDKGVTPKMFIETMHDSIGHTLCKIAKQHNAEMILLGQRGLGAIRRTLFGSVSDYVLHHTHIPVIVITPEQD